MPSQSVMQAAVVGKNTVSDRIRALAGTGASRSEIADFLGKRYQHVRQVLVEDERRRGARSPSKATAVETTPDVSRRTDAGQSVGGPFRLFVDPDGRVTLPAEVVRELGVTAGGVAVGRMQDGELMIQSAEAAMRKARALVRSIVPPDVSLAEQLLAGRRREAGE